MSHARVVMPTDESAPGALDVGGAGLGLHGAPSGAGMPQPYLGAGPQGHIGDGVAAIPQNDATSAGNQHSCRLWVEFNASAEGVGCVLRAVGGGV